MAASSSTASSSRPASIVSWPRGSGDGGAAATSSPKSRRGGAGRVVSSPMAQIVQEQVPSSPSDWSPSKASAGVDMASVDDSTAEAPPESSENVAAKKPVWNKPSNGFVEASPVMGAVSWPALSESTRASRKSSSSDSLKALSDGSLTALQGTGDSSSLAQKPIVTSIGHPSSTSNHVKPSRQRSLKHFGGSSNGNVSSSAVVNQPLPSPQDLRPESALTISIKSSMAAAESSTRDYSQKEFQRGGISNDQQHQRNSVRRGNGGMYPRGDSSYNHGHVTRRDQDRGNQEWAPHGRNFSNRDTNLQPPRSFPGGFVRPSIHTTTPYIHPPPIPVPMRPFSNHMLYPDVPSPVIYVQGVPQPENLRTVPMMAPIQPYSMVFPIPDTMLHARIVSQIDYYFSSDNLIKDTYLRQNMDDQGWVPIKLIAGFKKVMSLTDNIQLILEALRTSTVVEVQGDKIRKRNNWMKWIIAPNMMSSPLELAGNGRVSERLQNITLDESTANKGRGEISFGRASSGAVSSQFGPPGSEGTSQVSNQAGF